MIGTMLSLIVALAAFVGTHFLLSHPLRKPLSNALGASGFLLFYSVVALATLAWVIQAFRYAPIGEFLWAPDDALWALSTALMFIASVLLVGSFHGNPALPGKPGRPPERPKGVFAITRHPMMWAFAIWSVAHFIASPRPAVFLLMIAIGGLALGGSIAQDAKKKQLIGDKWREWTQRTSFVPFHGQITGRIPWDGSWPGRVALLGGTILWMLATWAHPWLGAPTAGLWRWIG